MAEHTLQDLKIKQALPLDIKVNMTKARIRAWVDHFGLDGVYVSFSGGKDSTVLLHIAREIYPDIKAVFVDTGLEYPEIRQFVKTFDNVDWVKPKMNFKQVIEKYGYPIISKEISQRISEIRTQAELNNIPFEETNLYQKHFDLGGKKFKAEYSYAKYKSFLSAPFRISHKCCFVMKKTPAKIYEHGTGRHPILATMAEESRLRTTQWLKEGCNAFENTRPTSTPMAFWTNQDVLKYIKDNNIEICSVYGNIITDYEAQEQLQGQMDICDLGLTEDTRPLKTTGCKRTGCMFCMFGCTFENWDNFTRMKETHPKQYEFIMKPKEQGGLGYKEVIDWINEHGNLNIKY